MHDRAQPSKTSPDAATGGFFGGLRAGLPVVLAVLPFGLLFGTIAVDNGLGVGETVLMSAIVFAGASQMVGIDLFGHEIAPWLIVLSVFAVNFRHVLYSAAMGRRIRNWSTLQKAIGFHFLTDPQYAEVERLGEVGRPIGFGWYAGLAAMIYIPWVFESWLGAVFGRLILQDWAVDLGFLLPIYFLGLVMSFRRRPRWLPVVAASAVVSLAAYVLIGPPWHVSLGALAGVLLAAALPPPAARDEV